MLPAHVNVFVHSNNIFFYRYIFIYTNILLKLKISFWKKEQKFSAALSKIGTSFCEMVAFIA